ncbi:MAG: hypothetical protein PF486_02395 [Prolixibacteraceae bacterium]|jgi:hypothetical protein|nr:hypothetical protein [Prolixibacteraceae bacterium]
MRKYRLTFYPLFFSIMIFLSVSCVQEEGIGGNSSIEGVLVEKYYNKDFTVFQFERPAKGENVYLQFGNSNLADEDVETSYSGNFKFEYLWNGDYTIYYYSDDTSLETADDIEIVHEVSIGKTQSFNIDTLYTYKALDWNDGTSKIKGMVRLINYKNESTPDNLIIKDVTPAQEQEVYLTYNDEDFYVDRIRTGSDGLFVFPDLIIGKYTVYVYSEDVSGNSTADIVVSVDVEITEMGQVVTIEDELLIEKI